MSERKKHEEQSKETPPADDANSEVRKPRIDWDDPSVPVGNAPSMPRWPLVVFGLAWVAWIVLMAVLAIDIRAGGGNG